MKRIIIFFIFICSFMCSYAQLPTWVKQTPISSNPNVAYEVGTGEGTTIEEARQKALYEVINKVLLRCNMPVSTQKKVLAAADMGIELKVIEKDYRFPVISEACREERKFGRGWRVWLLYHVPRDGSIINPQDYYDSFKGCQEYSEFSNGKSLAASFFIPGAGQMMKRRYAEGSFTLIGELALIGGGVGTYYIGKNQLRIMQDRAVEYDAYNSAKNMYNTMRIVSYTCYGVAAALYIFNLYRAYTITARPKLTYAFYPTLISPNDIDVAMGMGVTIKF